MHIGTVVAIVLGIIIAIWVGYNYAPGLLPRFGGSVERLTDEPCTLRGGPDAGKQGRIGYRDGMARCYAK